MSLMDRHEAIATISSPTSHPTARLPAGQTQQPPNTELAITVCIVNWNCVAYLRECLQSLFQQDQGVPFDVIVVDNASSDGAPEMVAQDFPQVTLIRNSANVGFSKANNQAARIATGQYLFFLNNDTVVPAGALAALFKIAQNHPQVGMFGPQLYDVNGHLQISHRRMPTVAGMLYRTCLFRWVPRFRRDYLAYRSEDFRPDEQRTVEVLLGAAVLVPRAVYHQCGGWDEDFPFGVEDVEYCARIGKKFSLMHLPSVRIKHYGRVSSRRNVAFSAPSHLKGIVLYFRKTGVSPRKVLLFKLALTMDAPITLMAKLLQAGIRLCFNKRQKAKKSILAAYGTWRFLTHDLPSFWQK
ncbi:MAG: glycosyltransferase family 2 protein [Zavarzinella sp.]